MCRGKQIFQINHMPGMFGTTCFEVLSIPEETYSPNIIEISQCSSSSVTVGTIKSEYLSNHLPRLGSGLGSIQLDYAS